MIKEIGIMTAAAVLSIGGVMGVSMAGTNAGTWHGLPGNNPANGGTSANPNGVGDGGNGIHGIAAGAPGQGAGDSAANGGNPPACTMHDGMQGEKKNCPEE